MYALIYDQHQLDHPQKRVFSVYTSRATAEKALEKRMKTLIGGYGNVIRESCG